MTGDAQVQAYQHWKRTRHPFMFIINNDVLVPDGALDKLMRAMQSTGAMYALNFSML